MGWAPAISLTGLWINLRGYLDFTWLFLFVSSLLTLLGNVSTSFDWIWNFDFSEFLTTLIQSLELSASRNNQPKITSRSQFRGQKLRYCASLALTLALGSIHCGYNVSAGGEGSTWSMTGGGVGFLPTKTHAEEPRMIFESHQTIFTKTSGQKRSYRRALNRIRQHGYTWYRGKILSGPKVSDPCVPSSIPTSANTAPKQRQTRSRFTCFSWNCGGMTQANWTHFQMWLQHQHLDIITLQESHWPFTSEWVQQSFFCVHTGFDGHQAGLLTMISKNLCNIHDLTWQVIQPGRILHIRVHGIHRHLDVVNVYQHIHHANRMTDRQSVWEALHDLVSTLPNRNTVIIAGDFNTSLRQNCTSVGTSGYLFEGRRLPGPTHSDEHFLQNLLQVHHLSALNTWKHLLGPTYQFLNQTSRIDFIFVQQHLVDDTARDVHYLHDFPLLNLTGARHVPLLCNIRKAWTPAQHEQAQGWTRLQRKELYQHWRQQDQYVQNLQRELSQQIDELSEQVDDRLTAVPECLRQHDGASYKKARPAFLQTVDSTPFLVFQYHTRCLRQMHGTGTDLGTLFQAWKHTVGRLRARKLMNQNSKEAHKRRLMSIYDSASSAANAKDHFGFYQAIRELAPKQPFQRVQLRSDTGTLLGPAEAADALQQWYTGLYDAPDSNLSPESFHWPFTAEHMQDALLQLPAFKALASPYAPAPIWKMAASSISAYLQPYLIDSSDHGNLPKCWSQGELTFLPKPGKKGHQAADLRPIALLEPTGKCAMGLFAEQLFHQTSDRLLRLPQYAYLPGRGTDEAISRVQFHCLRVRELIDSHKYRFHTAARTSTINTESGGFVISLDLSKAFDSVCRQRLLASLQSLGVHSDLIQFLANVYSETSFSFQHRGQHRVFNTKRGIRQGCKAAPLLWACFAASIMTDVAQLTDWEWLYNSVTAYADDFCLHCLCHNADDLHRSLKYVGRFLDLLKNAELTINMAKTVALFKMQGPRMSRIYKNCVKRTKEGCFLCIPCRDERVLIRLVNHFSYLGVIMSYTNFELLSVKHRIKAGIKVSHQLSRWIHKKIGLTSRQKLRLWYQCIFPCVTYGLRTIGLNSQTLQMIDRFFMLQLRRIFHAPVHITRTSHCAFLADHNIPDPLQRFYAQCCQAIERETQRLPHLAADDILHQHRGTCLATLAQAFAEVHQLRRAHSTDLEEASRDYECHVCNIRFQTVAALRRHWTIAHEHRTGPLRQFSMNDSSQGLPTCNRCDMKFTTWHSLQYHVTYVCTATRQEEDDLEHRLRVREFLHFVRGMSFVALGQTPALTAYFLNRCILCGKYVLSSKGLMAHWGREHNAHFRAHGPWNDFLHQQIGIESPCMLCGAQFQRMHHCVIIRQYAMHLSASGQQPPRELGTAQETFPCEHCSKVFVTRHGLHQHLRKFHTAIQAGDALPDAHIDAHCHITQAVETASCVNLLGDDAVAELMSQTCLICHTTFSRKNELMRHLRHHHTMLWNKSESLAIQLDAQLKPTQHCYCVPAAPQRKHVCLLFIQYALMRIQLGEAPDAAAAALAPPEQLLGTKEIIKQLCWLGLLPLVQFRPMLRLALTLHCQLCNTRFQSSALLMMHLRTEHLDALRACDSWTTLLMWVIFCSQGCLCNPAENHGTPGHTCPMLIQLAILITQDTTSVIIPWHYRAVDILDVFEPLINGPALTRVSTMLMARQFEALMLSSDVHRLLTSQCIWCDEAVPIARAVDHLRTAHHFDPACLTAIIS